MNQHNSPKVLVLAEYDHNGLKPQTLSVLGAAKQISDDVSVVVVGGGQVLEKVFNQVDTISIVKRLLAADAPTQFEHGLAENVSEVLKAIMAGKAQFQQGKSLNFGFEYLLCSTSTYSKNILPRVAALLDVTQISNVVKILPQEPRDTFVRSCYAGNVLATVQSLEPIKILTIQPTAFDQIPLMKKDSPKNIPEVESFQLTPSDQYNVGLSSFIENKLSIQSRPELESARIVISGGRGLKSKENFKLLEDLADKLHAAIGASRAAVDAGFISNDYQVGQTGKTIRPELYIAIGISGAIQHVSGMKDSKVIVAINKDKEAPIFQMADYGLVGDLFQILPELTQEITKVGIQSAKS